MLESECHPRSYAHRGLAFTYFCVYVVRQVELAPCITEVFFAKCMPPKNYEISGHYFLVCVLSHQRKRCHRRRRCRSTTINCKTARIFVQKFFCDRLGSPVWSLVDCSVASSQVELVTGILRPRPEAPSGNESKLSWLIWSESPLCWSPLRQCQVVKYFFRIDHTNTPVLRLFAVVKFAGLPLLQGIIVFMIGFFLYGPQMLIGAVWNKIGEDIMF